MNAPEPSVSARVLEAVWPGFRSILTRRQAELLILVADGLSQQEIAQAMGISTKTVEGHLRAIRRALGVRDRRPLAAILLRLLVERLSREPGDLQGA